MLILEMWSILFSVSELESLFGKNGTDALVGAKGINDELVKILENLREQLQAGFPAYGIPSLDPFFIPRAAIDIESGSAKYAHENKTK